MNSLYTVAFFGFCIGLLAGVFISAFKRQLLLDVKTSQLRSALRRIDSYQHSIKLANVLTSRLSGQHAKVSNKNRRLRERLTHANIQIAELRTRLAPVDTVRPLFPAVASDFEGSVSVREG